MNELKTDARLLKTAVSDRMCYVVECSAGSWDDYHTWIAGIFPDAFSAEKLKDEINNKVEIAKNIPAPYKEEDLEFLTEEQNDIFHKWRNENNDAYEFNLAKVVEYPFGKSCR